ncbi:MAG TPA: IS1634 family transposase [Sphaerochaeta sp.]|nr:IS1634 family transposase [Sphaerochaeta sp.]
MNMNPFAAARIHTHAHLPIAAAYCRKMNLMGIVDRLVPSQMELSPGLAVQALVLDTLSGRSPLYRVQEFWEQEDRTLLLGPDVQPSLFNDNNLGRALDAIFEAGPSRIITEVGIHVAREFGLDVSAISYDTTSINVWGEYAMCGDPSFAGGPRVTYGHSKDKRPDLKQLMAELLCADRGVPIFSSALNGNSSDKRSNNRMLSRVSGIMARHGLREGCFVYIADGALVSGENLEKLSSIRFVSRLPATYGCCPEAIDRAVEAGTWTELGTLAELQPSRKAASYKAFETGVTIEGREYRTVVIHSDSHDRRRQKAIERKLESSHKELSSKLKGLQSRYYCEQDAREAVRSLEAIEGPLHTIKATYTEVAVNKRGRPPKEGPRPVNIYHDLSWEIVENEGKVNKLRERAGCFVLLTNVPVESLDAKELLRSYKGQHSIEANFSFLKDPLVVNDLFLKTPSRIDALGMILVLSLMVWRLMERQMRLYLESEDKVLPGWDKKPTDRPTSFMMSTVFQQIMVAHLEGEAYLLKPLSDRQLLFLQALGLDERVFMTEVVPTLTYRRSGKPSD